MHKCSGVFLLEWGNYVLWFIYSAAFITIAVIFSRIICYQLQIQLSNSQSSRSFFWKVLLHDKRVSLTVACFGKLSTEICIGWLHNTFMLTEVSPFFSETEPPKLLQGHLLCGFSLICHCKAFWDPLNLNHSKPSTKLKNWYCSSHW